MKPRQVLRALEKALPPNAMVSTDIGNICSLSNSYLRFEQPRSFFAAMTFGNCGYSLPAIMGAKVAAPNRPAFAYVGTSPPPSTFPVSAASPTLVYRHGCDRFVGSSNFTASPTTNQQDKCVVPEFHPLGILC